MRSYVRNTKSADAVVPMVLDKPTPASAATVQMSGSGTTLSSFALSRQELEKMDLKLCLFQVRFSSMREHTRLDAISSEHSRE